MKLSEHIKNFQKLLDDYGDGELYTVHGASGATDETGYAHHLNEQEKQEICDLFGEDPAEPIFSMYIGN